MDKPDTVITVCMGSSCFSRGNNRNTESIERFLREHNLTERVEVRGCLCEGHCKEGPNIHIGSETLRGVRPELVPDLLSHKIGGTSE